MSIIISNLGISCCKDLQTGKVYRAEIWGPIFVLLVKHMKYHVTHAWTLTQDTILGMYASALTAGKGLSCNSDTG